MKPPKHGVPHLPFSQTGEAEQDVRAEKRSQCRDGAVTAADAAPSLQDYAATGVQIEAATVSRPLGVELPKVIQAGCDGGSMDGDRQGWLWRRREESKFRAVDWEGQEWELAGGAIVKGRSFS